MTARPIRRRATLTASLRALELVRDGDAQLLLKHGRPDAAAARIAIIDNARIAAIELAVAVRAAAAGDIEPARRIAHDLRLDQLEIRP